jgi:hypothetical protein
MRTAARTDRNQEAIVIALRHVGASVQILSGVGRGCPDLLIGFRGQNWLAEVKDGMKPMSKQSLTPDEEDWQDDWAGQVRVVRGIEDALRLIGVL